LIKGGGPDTAATDDRCIARGAVDWRPVADMANTVPTRHAAIDCIVLLAGRAGDDRPTIHDRSSRATHNVIHAHVTHTRVRAPDDSQ
jgi:hypothetical protein